MLNYIKDLLAQYGLEAWELVPTADPRRSYLIADLEPEEMRDVQDLLSVKFSPYVIEVRRGRP